MGTKKIFPVDGEIGDNFGYDMCIHSENEFLVSAYNDDLYKGSVYLYSYFTNAKSFIQKLKIQGNDSITQDQFGYAIASNSLNIFITAPNHFNKRGAVYIFEKKNSTYVQVNKILSPIYNIKYGESITLSYPYLFIGAPGYNNNTGCVFVYQHNSITNEYLFSEIVHPPKSASFDNFFGNTLDSNEKQLIIGSYGYNKYSGAVYIYDRNYIGKWTQNQRLRIFNSYKKDWFGYSVYLYENFLIVGAPGNGNIFGEVYIYQYLPSIDIYREFQQISPYKGYRNDEFGLTVSMDSTSLYITTGESYNNNKGSVYIFQLNNNKFIEVGIMQALIRSSYDYFGFNIIPFNNEYLLISADGTSNNIGAVYIYDKPSKIDIVINENNEKKKIDTTNIIIIVSVIIMIILILLIIIMVFKIVKIDKNKDINTNNQGNVTKMTVKSTKLETNPNKVEMNNREIVTNKPKEKKIDFLKNRNDRRVDKTIDAGTPNNFLKTNIINSPSAIHTPSKQSQTNDERIIEQKSGLLDDNEIDNNNNDNDGTHELILSPLKDDDDDDDTDPDIGSNVL